MGKQKNPTNTLEQILSRVGANTKLYDHLGIDELADMLEISVDGALICMVAELVYNDPKRGVLVHDAVKFLETAEYRFIQELDFLVHPQWNPYTTVDTPGVDHKVMTEVVLQYLDHIVGHVAGRSAKSK